MLTKFLREVVTLVVGKQAEVIADLLHNKKHVNEFIISKKLNITINQTRNILYKISDYGLVSSIRKKDKRKGWYTYFWKIEILKSLEFLRSVLLKKIDQIQKQIKSREVKQFYVCEKCNVEFNEENALLNDFTCSECGNIFALKDNTHVLKELKKTSTKLTKELEAVEQEIEIEQNKLEKIRQKEIRKKKEEKTLARKKKVAERKKAKAKLAPKKSKFKKKAVKRKPIKKKKSVKKKKVVKKKVRKKKLVKKKIVKKKVVKKKPAKKSKPQKKIKKKK